MPSCSLSVQITPTTGQTKRIRNGLFSSEENINIFFSFMAVDRDFSDTPASERHLAIVRTILWKQDFPSLHDYSDNKTNGRSKNFGPDRKRGSCSTAHSQFSLLSRSERAKLGLSWICKEDIIQAFLGRLQLYLRSLLHGVTPTAQLVFHRAFLFLCRRTPFFFLFFFCSFDGNWR